MKLKLSHYFVLASALSVIGASSAHAETDVVEKAYIPFDFYAKNQKLPAGNYEVGLDVEGDIISLSDKSGHNVLLLGVPADEGGAERSGLVFDHSGDSYFLREVKSDEIDVSFPTTKENAAKGESAHLEPAVVPLTPQHS